MINKCGAYCKRNVQASTTTGKRRKECFHNSEIIALLALLRKQFYVSKIVAERIGLEPMDRISTVTD